MENEYASKGAVNTANALGGTALGIELLRALFGGGLGGGCAGGAVRTAGALAEGQLCASLMAENGALKAEKYADRNTADVYTALNARDNRIVDKLSNIEKWQAAEMASMFARADLAAYQATALNTPQTGYSGQVACVQFASTNSTGTATVAAVTDLLVGGSVVSFTNVLATATLTNGVANVAPQGVYVAPRQRIVVYGDAFPGGSATVWMAR